MKFALLNSEPKNNCLEDCMIEKMKLLKMHLKKDVFSKSQFLKSTLSNWQKEKTEGEKLQFFENDI